MDTQIEFDQRIRKYEEKCHITEGKGHAVNVDAGTRIYREIGHPQQFHHWMRDVQESFDGEVIPFEWVADYVGVTRAALHKRVKKGNLTVLVFEMHENVIGVLGGIRERMRREYRYIPKTECDQWRDILSDQYREKYL